MTVCRHHHWAASGVSPLWVVVPDKVDWVIVRRTGNDPSFVRRTGKLPGTLGHPEIAMSPAPIHFWLPRDPDPRRLLPLGPWYVERRWCLPAKSRVRDHRMCCLGPHRDQIGRIRLDASGRRRSLQWYLLGQLHLRCVVFSLGGVLLRRSYPDLGLLCPPSQLFPPWSRRCLRLRPRRSRNDDVQSGPAQREVRLRLRPAHR